jgi:glycine/D-amino acid oxidase-like deaminating enzyme
LELSTRGPLWHGRDQADVAASLASIDLVEQIIEEERIDCNFSRCGPWSACKQSHFEPMVDRSDRAEFNHPCALFKDTNCHEIGSEIYCGMVVTSVRVNPARYVAGLGRAALKAGACVFENTRVERIERASGDGTSGFRLVTSRGDVFAENVFIATSGYTSNTTPALRKKIIPIGSFIITTERLPEALARELSPRNRMIFDSKHYLYYYRLTPDNRTLSGGPCVLQSYKAAQ